MADTSQFQLYYAKETDGWGVPMTTPTLTEVPITGESLTMRQDSARSSRIRASRLPGKTRRIGASADGGYDFELAYGAQDGIIAGWCMSDWSAQVDVSGSDIAAATTGNKYTSATASKFASVLVGHWIKAAGFSNSANNGYSRVIAKSGDDLEITVEGITLVTEGASASVTINALAFVAPATTFTSFIFEKFWGSLASGKRYQSFPGCVLDTMALNIQPGQFITGSFGVIGKNRIAATSTIGDGSPTAAPATDETNAVDDVKQVWIDGAASTMEMTQISLNGANNNAARQAIMVAGASGIRLGTVDVNGTFAAYFDETSDVLVDASDANTPISLSYRVQDLAGNNYIVDQPECRPTQADVLAGAQNQDAVVNFNFNLDVEESTSTYIRFSRLPV